MILIDTSIWIDYLNRGDAIVEKLLKAEAVMMHSDILGEIALGSLKNRSERLTFLKELERVPSASDTEVMAMIEWKKLHSSGIGYVDAHLLASVSAADPEFELLLWTRDKKLAAIAERFEILAKL
jgi:predicted nucleic acid-binding protein